MNDKEEAKKVEGVVVPVAVEESKAQAVEPVVDPDAAKREGIKDAVENSEAMAVEKAKVEPVPDKAVRPSFFVKKDARHRIEVDILASKRDGRIMSISRTGLGLDFDKDFSYLQHDVE
jgi:hypothetical protein